MIKEINGIIIINKEKEYTSNDVVCKVKRILQTKVGHIGTLDPNATGVLPLLLGKGTKISKYLIEHDKIYKAKIKLGIKTDTADIEGNIIEEKEVPNLDIKKIKQVLKEFEGKMEQFPPIYSAIKVNGKKLYEYARSGQNVDIKPRNIEIFDISYIDYNEKEKELDFKVHTSKGTYIRSLCEDIAKKLGTVGYMKELERTKVGNFHIEDSITINKLDENKLNDSFLEKYILSIEEMFNSKEKIILNKENLKLFYNGVLIKIENKDGIYSIYNQENIFIGLGVIKQGVLKRDVVVKQ